MGYGWVVDKGHVGKVHQKKVTGREKMPVGDNGEGKKVDGVHSRIYLPPCQCLSEKKK